jgi:hypothetical protein
MPDAKYFVIARDVEQNLAAIEPIVTNKTGLSLRLEPGLSISGTVQDEKGAALTHADINLNMMAGNMGGMVEYQPIKLNAEGAFTIPALPMGQQYYVYASVKGYGSVNKNIGKNSEPYQQHPVVAVQDEARRPRAGRPGAGHRRQAAARRGGQHQRQRPAEWQHANGRERAIPVQGVRRADTNLRVVAIRGGAEQFRQRAGAWRRHQSGGENGRAAAAAPDRHAGCPADTPALDVERRGGRGRPVTRPGMIILLSLQAAVLLGTGGGVFWFARQRGRREN